MTWTEQPLSQTHPCNGGLLLFFRERRRLTQKGLTVAAECSDTQLSDAEAGQPIAVDVIDRLATALSTDEEPIYPEDLISDPLALAKEYNAAVHCRHKNTFETIRHFLDEQVVFWIAGDPVVIPFAGRHQGLAEVQRLFELFFSVLEVPENHNHEPFFSYVAQGNVAIILGETWIHPIGAPMDEPLKVTNRLTFRKGKLVLFEDAFDTDAGAELLNVRLNQEAGQVNPDK